MHILITGGTGLIGTALSEQLRRQGHDVTVWTRRTHEPSEGVVYVTALQDCAEPIDMVVNLAGANLAERRWSRSYKAEIRRSRIDLTAHLIAWMRSCSRPPRRLISASAIGYYGVSDDETFDETSAAGHGFAAELCRDWEQAARSVADHGVEVVTMRLGVVLAGQGSALQKMTQSFKFGIESWLGSGEQWLSWIHLLDAVHAIEFAMIAETPAAVYNAVAPEPVRHRDFARAVGKQSGALVRLPVPDFVARAIAGEMAQELLLSGQRVLPLALQQEAFHFHYPSLEQALQSIRARGSN
jgi:uncharacterized protein (TIGR01777 family)